MLLRDRARSVSFTLCLLLFVRVSQQHGSGAPSGACKDQTPKHASIQAQTSLPPYIITTSSSLVRQGDTIGVTITSAPGLPTTIGGFILQARVVQKPDTTVGQFLSQADPQSQLVTCSSNNDTLTHTSPADKQSLTATWQAPNDFLGGVEFSPCLPLSPQFLSQADPQSQLVTCSSNNDTLTHTSPADKQSLTATWQAPNDFLGGVEFRATVAQGYATFWKGVESPIVEVVTVDTPIPESKRPHAIYEGCQDKKLCFGVPRNCIQTADCKAIVTIKVAGNTYTWEILGTGNPKYVAAALSDDTIMGDDSVVECVKDDDGKIQLYTSWTYPKIDPYVNRTDSPQNLASLVSTAAVADSLYCKFTRKAVSEVKGRQFNLARDLYHLMLVSGEEMKDANRVGFHSLVYEATPNKVSLSRVGDARNLQAPPVIKEDKPKESPRELDSIYQGCSTEKLCFGTPAGCVDNSDCKAVLAILVKGDSYTMEIQGTGNPKYVAAGLSKDNKMGDDSAMECVRDDRGRINLYTSWTYPKAEPYVNRKESPQEIVQLLESSMADGKLYCKFKRDTVSTVKGQTFDLAKDRFNLMVLAGDSMKDTDRVGFHNLAYEATDTPQLLSGVGTAAGSSKLLLKLHGSFMIAAWLAAAACGMIVARYFRQTWVGSQLGGKDIWFAYHRLVMVLTWLLTMAGFIIILVEVGGWSPTGDNPHGITGLVTVILCFLQPIGAYFRPHPGTKRRPAFNWLHWLGGNAAHILGIVTIFLAVSLPKAELPAWSVYILAAYVAFHVFMHLVLSLTVCVSDGRISQSRVNSFPMKDMLGQPRPATQLDRSVDAPYSSFRKLILSIYAPIVILIAAAMISLVVLAPISQTYNQIMGA